MVTPTTGEVVLVPLPFSNPSNSGVSAVPIISWDVISAGGHGGYTTLRSAKEARRSLVEYDEDRELTHYIWDHYQRLMTEFEWRVGRAIIGRTKAAAAGSPEMAGALRRWWGEVGVPEVEAALADGSEVFRQRVRERLLSARGAEVFVNRCPRCARVARTPQARQCFWCGFDWHGQIADPGTALGGDAAER